MEWTSEKLNFVNAVQLFSIGDDGAQKNSIET